LNKKVLAVIVISLAVIMVATPFFTTVNACCPATAHKIPGKNPQAHDLCRCAFKPQSHGCHFRHSTVHAKPQTIVSRGIVAGKWYTQINVVLGGVNNTIRIPDDWNGGLVVLCRGSSQVEVSPNEIPLDTQSKAYVSVGAATAANHFSFGSGFSIKDAIIRTHQLTEYVVDNYGVSGAVFLVGVSFGGQVALMLGEKYPELYNGVLDIVGPKDYITGYEWLKHCADLSIPELIAEFTALNLSPFPHTFESFQQYCLTTTAKMEADGIEEKTKPFERYSPVYHADIQIPVITIAGAHDAIVPLSQHYAYQAAVAEAGHADLYRLVIVPNGAHFDFPVQQQIGPCMQTLYTWVVDGVPPP